MLILPGNPLFDQTLGRNLPPDGAQFAASHSSFYYVARSGSGILEPVDERGLEEYLEGGEYEEVLQDGGDEEALAEFYGLQGQGDEEELEEFYG
jgi:hypothetical protein